MVKIRRNDTVIVTAGKDRHRAELKDRTGKVLRIFPDKGRALVERMHLVKKHVRRQSQQQQGGIIEQESSIHLSNLMLVCPRCQQPTRVGFAVQADGAKTRVCKKCREAIDTK